MEEGQDLAVLNEISGDHSGSDQGTNTTDGHSFHLPAYLAYLSLGFKVKYFYSDHCTNGWLGYYHN